jgi:hypothetical protein
MKHSIAKEIISAGDARRLGNKRFRQVNPVQCGVEIFKSELLSVVRDDRSTRRRVFTFDRCWFQRGPDVFATGRRYPSSGLVAGLDSNRAQCLSFSGSPCSIPSRVKCRGSDLRPRPWTELSPRARSGRFPGAWSFCERAGQKRRGSTRFSLGPRQFYREPQENILKIEDSHIPRIEPTNASTALRRFRPVRPLVCTLEPVC